MVIAMVELAFIHTYFMYTNKESNMLASRHFIVVPSTRCMVVLFAGLLLSAHTAFAQEQAALYMGPFEVTPSIAVDVEKDDNLFEATSGNEVSSTLTLVRPSISAFADDGVKSYTIEYSLENGTYSDTSNNDYTNHDLSANLEWRVDIRNLIEFNASLQRSHEGRSEDSVTDFNAADLNEFTDEGLTVNYTFGGEGSRGRINIGFETNSLRYKTNREDTAVLESETDIKTLEFSAGFSPGSRINFQVIDTGNSFPNNPLSDREDISYLIGAQWEINDLVTGDVRVGRSDNDLLNVAGGDTSTSTWDAEIEWQQNENSVFTLSAGKSVENTDNNVGVFIDASDIGFDWAYQWTDLLALQVSLQQQEDEFVGAGRTDDTHSVNLGVSYTLRRWLTLTAEVGYQERDSTDDLNDFEKNTVMLSISASL